MPLEVREVVHGGYRYVVDTMQMMSSNNVLGPYPPVSESQGALRGPPPPAGEALLAGSVRYVSQYLRSNIAEIHIRTLITSLDSARLIL